MNKYCPNCKMNFSESFEECPYCEGELIEKELDKSIIPTQQYIQQTQPSTASVTKIWGLVGVCILVIFLMAQGFVWLNGDNKNDNNICSSCHKTFTNRADTKSIAWTSMCEPCYENLKFKEEMKEELHKMEERGLLD